MNMETDRGVRKDVCPLCEVGWLARWPAAPQATESPPPLCRRRR